MLCLTIAGSAGAQALDEANINRPTDPIVQDDSSRVAIEGTVVDENGIPVRNVRVRVRSILATVPAALSDSKGVFRFTLDLPSTRYLTFLADDLKEGRRGYAYVHEEGTIRLPGPVKIVLKQPRELVVGVTDSEGKPVEDASVLVKELMFPIEDGRTGPDGTIRFRLPQDVKLDSVVALKSGGGFDYWLARPSPRAEPRDVPPTLALTLSGAATARIRAIDNRNQPVQGIDVLPWTIKRVGRSDHVNVSGVYFGEFAGLRTDANGVVIIDWLPADLAKTEFVTTSRKYHLPEEPELRGKPADGGEIIMRLIRCTAISGRVLTPDGRPAAGVVVQAEGRGTTAEYYRDLTRTNAAGEFAFDAYPDEAYLVAVLNEKWAAPSQFVAQLKEEVPVRGLELRLGPGTALRGRVTSAEGRPRSNATVTLVQNDTVPAGGPKVRVALVRWARTDADGRYEFRIGPGKYELTAPDEKSVALEVDQQAELIRDFHAK